MQDYFIDVVLVNTVKNNCSQTQTHAVSYVHTINQVILIQIQMKSLTVRVVNLTSGTKRFHLEIYRYLISILALRFRKL